MYGCGSRLLRRSKLDWRDPLRLMDSQLTEEERAVHEAARAYAQSQLLPGIVRANRERRFDRQIMRQLGELNFLGATLQGYGCAGTTSVAYGLIARALEQVDSAYRSALSVQSSLVMFPIDAFGTDAQKQRYLSPLARGELIGCFGLTEPNHGSDPGSMETTALRDGDAYVLNGTKTWITNSPLADICVVWAKTHEHRKSEYKSGDETDGIIRGFLLERDMPGLSTPTLHDKASLLVSETGQIVMEEVRVPLDNVLPMSQGLKSPFQCLSNAR
jgi:glutaryl-CoA dehydrogenase